MTVCDNLLKMNEYILYTTEGETIAPDKEVEIENCQVLGRIQAKNAEQAKQLLVQENPWIEEAGFDTTEIVVRQLLTEAQKADIKAIVDYLSEGRYENLQEMHSSEEYVYRIIKRLKSCCE